MCGEETEKKGKGIMFAEIPVESVVVNVVRGTRSVCISLDDISLLIWCLWCDSRSFSMRTQLQETHAHTHAICMAQKCKSDADSHRTNKQTKRKEEIRRRPDGNLPPPQKSTQRGRRESHCHEDCSEVLAESSTVSKSMNGVVRYRLVALTKDVSSAELLTLT